MNREQKNQCMEIIAWYGTNKQLLQTAEECSELAKECIKHANRGADNVTDIADEIADVEIMLEQAKTALNIHSDVKDRIEFKLERTLGRVAKDKK